MGEPTGPAGDDRGVVVFSLDFELHWGVHDVASVDAWHSRLLGARRAVPRLLDLMQEYDIAATWAVVGMLFAEDSEELRALRPSVCPTYRDSTLSPYNVPVGEDEEDDPFHYAPSLIRRIAETPNQEIATHTFSHYYCHEGGQTRRQFEVDLESAIRATQKIGSRPTSIVFPRNQLNLEYLSVLREHGFSSFRGPTQVWPYVAGSEREANTLPRRIGRLVNTYIPVFGRTSCTRDDIRVSRTDGMVNIPASAFIRSHMPKRRRLEPLRSWRIETELRHAAREGRIVHLWTHPHNFGEHMETNLSFLRGIFSVIRDYVESGQLVSTTMSGFVEAFA